MRPEFISNLAKELQLPREAVAAAIRTGHSRIRRIEFRKKNGRNRVAFQPAASVKPILIWLRLNALCLLPVNQIATAFRKGSSILSNAEAHRNSKYSVRIDLKDFFPSITAHDVARLLDSSLPSEKDFWQRSDIVDLASAICFDRHGRIPIGFPTSPDLANAVMHQIDTTLLSEISNIDVYGDAVLTRYADDFVFSTDKAGACRVFLSKFRSVIESSNSPQLRVNESKTRFMSKAGGSTLITGLRINNQSNVRVHAEYRDHVRLLIHLFKNGKLNPEEWPKLIGHLAFIQYADPAFFTRLAFRYADEIAQLRSTSENTESISSI